MGSFTWEFGIRVKKKALEMGVSFCRVTRGGRSMGTFHEIVTGLWKVSITLCGSSVRGLLSGDQEGYGEEGSGDGHHHRRPMCLGPERARTKILFNSIAYKILSH